MEETKGTNIGQDMADDIYKRIKDLEDILFSVTEENEEDKKDSQDINIYKENGEIIINIRLDLSNIQTVATQPTQALKMPKNKKKKSKLLKMASWCNCSNNNIELSPRFM